MQVKSPAHVVKHVCILDLQQCIFSYVPVVDTQGKVLDYRQIYALNGFDSIGKDIEVRFSASMKAWQSTRGNGSNKSERARVAKETPVMQRYFAFVR